MTLLTFLTLSIFLIVAQGYPCIIMIGNGCLSSNLLYILQESVKSVNNAMQKFIILLGRWG